MKTKSFLSKSIFLLVIVLIAGVSCDVYYKDNNVVQNSYNNKGNTVGVGNRYGDNDVGDGRRYKDNDVGTGDYKDRDVGRGDHKDRDVGEGRDYDYKKRVSRKQAHPWHGVSSGTEDCKEVNAIVLNSQGNNVAYLLNQKAGILELGAFLPDYLQFPANFGLIPKTLTELGGPLDIVIISSQALQDQALVETRVLGALKVKYEKVEAYSIIAVPKVDPAYEGVYDIKDLPEHILLSIKQFFKALDANNTLEIKGFVGAKQAIYIVEDAVKLYKKKFDKDC